MNRNHEASFAAEESAAEADGARVVLACDSGLSFCGRLRGRRSIDGREGLLVETDAESGFCVWCPLPFVRQLTVVPIREERPEDPRA